MDFGTFKVFSWCLRSKRMFPFLSLFHLFYFDIFQSLIPDIKVSQEAVVELHPEELQLSGDEENLDANRGDQDKDLKIRRTVTQVTRSTLVLLSEML